MKFENVTLEGMDDVAKAIISELKNGDTVFLEGDLAAGKTTLSKIIAKKLGIQANITSPTFNIVKEYEAPHVNFVHMDAYRLGPNYDGEEFDEYLFGKNRIMFIEWASYLKMDIKAIKIKITKTGDTREVNVQWY